MTQEEKAEETKIKKAFFSWKPGRFHLNFPNGNNISTVWGFGTYSENYEYDCYGTENGEFVDERHQSFGSDTVEIMFSCGEKLRKRILKKYNDGDDDPIGYLPQDKWLEIVRLVSNEKITLEKPL